VSSPPKQGDVGGRAAGDRQGGGGSSAATSPAAAPRKKSVDAKPVATVAVDPDDPAKGKFTLEAATKGLREGDFLQATIQTNLGDIVCRLYPDKAPITVANFIGLARGLRAWKTPSGKWEKKRAYDGTTFHRVVPGFVIQGGDPLGTGGGEPGYVIPDEVWQDGYHDRDGLLCMANRGANTNGMQFFITLGATANLDGGYTIFGECGPSDVVQQIGSVEVNGSAPKQKVEIKAIEVKRALTPKAGAPAVTGTPKASVK
jgi:peptidyl-prolyl cis-trans isomerase A (cyclophilin A)